MFWKNLSNICRARILHANSFTIGSQRKTMLSAASSDLFCENVGIYQVKQRLWELYDRFLRTQGIPSCKALMVFSWQSEKSSFLEWLLCSYVDRLCCNSPPEGAPCNRTLPSKQQPHPLQSCNLLDLENKVSWEPGGSLPGAW